MHKYLIALLFALAFAGNARAVTIQWSPVGNPGNAGDPTVIVDGTSGHGAVAYSYSIGTYDVTNSQYVEFLNAKDPTGADPLGLYNSSMSSSPFGGISYNSGAASGAKYSAISGDGQHPVNYVTWYDTLRFANWMNNGQGNADTETGSYTLSGGAPTPSNANTITRSAGATIVLPSQDEWYKAAFYNPTTSSYFHFPTSFNAIPNVSAPTAAPNSVNYENVVKNLTNVGAYTGTTSPYGAFDMGGNVFQWNEAFAEIQNGIPNSVGRGARGSSFNRDLNALLSVWQFGFDPTVGIAPVGFRLAMVPEPSTFALAAMALAFVALAAWRRRPPHRLA